MRPDRRVDKAEGKHTNATSEVRIAAGEEPRLSHANIQHRATGAGLYGAIAMVIRDGGSSSLRPSSTSSMTSGGFVLNRNAVVLVVLIVLAAGSYHA